MGWDKRLAEMSVTDDEIKFKQSQSEIDKNLNEIFKAIYEYEKSVEFQNKSGQEMEIIKIMKEVLGNDVQIKQAGERKAIIEFE